MVLGLFLITPSWADDIRDFQIEGMSVGDSALDYFSETKINSLQKNFYPKSKKFFYVLIGPEKKFIAYEKVKFTFKENDKNYKIYALSGVFDYPNSIKQCYKKRKEIISELDAMFHTAKKDNYTFKYPSDTSGKSKATVKDYFLEDGEIRIWCTDWSKNSNVKNYTDNLQVSIQFKEYSYWIKNEAYK